MQIQQKDNETLAAYIHHFKTAAKHCTFDNNTMAICIFVKGLGDVHTITAKIYEKDPQTLSEVIRLLEKLNAAQQLTATLTPTMVSMMSNDDRYFVCGQTGHFHYHCLVAQCYGCDEFGNFAHDCSNKIPPYIPTPKGTDCTPPIMVPDMEDISANNNPTAIPTMTGAVVSEGTHDAPYFAIAASHTALWPMDAPIAFVP